MTTVIACFYFALRILGHTMNSRKILKYVVSFGLFALIVSQIDFDILRHETKASQFKYVALSVGTIICQILFLSLRWQNLLNARKHHVDFSASLFMNLASFFANVLFITSVGGIVAKSGLAIRHGVSVFYALIATLLDRLLTLAALLIFSFMALPVLAHILDKTIIYMLWMSVYFILLILVLGIILVKSGALRDFILGNRKRARAIHTLRHMVFNPSLILKVIGYSLAAQACFIISVYVLSLDMTYTGTTLEFLALLPVIALISSLPISFGGWGIREGAFIYGLGLIGFSMESAFLLSVQVGVVTMVAPVLMSLPFVFRQNTRHLFFKTSAHKVTE